MPRPPNQHLAHDLVRAAADVLAERGVDGFTVKDVAARVGYSPATVYLYFENRDALLDSAVDRATEWFLAAISEAARGVKGRDLLRNTSRAYVEWGIRNPSLYRLMFEQRMPTPAEGEKLERRRRGLAMHRSMMAEIFAADRGGPGPKDRDVASDMVFVVLHGTVSLAVAGRLWGPHLSQDEQVARGLQLIDGMVSEWAADWGLGDQGRP